MLFTSSCILWFTRHSTFTFKFHVTMSKGTDTYMHVPLWPGPLGRDGHEPYIVTEVCMSTWEIYRYKQLCVGQVVMLLNGICVWL